MMSTDTLTWKEFKDKIESQGVKDDDIIWMIDLTRILDVDDITAFHSEAGVEIYA